MNRKEIVSINKKNKELVKLLEEITQCEVSYTYRYKTQRLFIITNDPIENTIILCFLYGANNDHQNDFRIFTIDEVYNNVKEKYELSPNSKHKLYIKMIFDEYFKPTEKKQQKARVKV